MSISFNVHHSVNLGYSFPSAEETDIEFTSNLPRDTFLTKNLKLEALPHPKEPYYSKYPITKCYSINSSNSDTTENPLYEIFTENQKVISQYKLELPYSRKNTDGLRQIVKTKQNDETEYLTRGIKRSRKISEDTFNEQKNTQECLESLYKTPVLNKTIFFSSSASAKKKNSTNLLQSTPVSNIGEISNKKTSSLFAKHKLLKSDRAELLDLPIKPSDKFTEIRHDKETEESLDMASDYDHLACHAGNIMRMAIDSTMLGSSYNDSFSSTFNNTFGGNDSIIGLLSRKRYNDILDDDADKSLLENMKSRWSSGLDRLKAKKFDINADELKQAIQAD